MKFIENLQDSPKWLVYTVGGVCALLVGYSWLRPSTEQPVQVIDNTLDYSPELVALGTNAALQREQMTNELEMAKLASSTALGINDANIHGNNYVVSSAERLAATQMQNEYAFNVQSLNGTMAMTEAQSNRDYSIAALQVANGSQKAVFDYNIGNRAIDLQTGEMNQQYNLLNYQTMVEHDLEKKRIKSAEKQGFINSGLKLLGL